MVNDRDRDDAAASGVALVLARRAGAPMDTGGVVASDDMMARAGGLSLLSLSSFLLFVRPSSGFCRCGWGLVCLSESECAPTGVSRSGQVVVQICVSFGIRVGFGGEGFDLFFWLTKEEEVLRGGKERELSSNRKLTRRESLPALIRSETPTLRTTAWRRRKAIEEARAEGGPLLVHSFFPLRTTQKGERELLPPETRGKTTTRWKRTRRIGG